MFQMVDTPEQAREIVSCMKYRPRGIRGVTTQHYYDRFTAGDLAPKLAAEDHATTMIALIESRLGVENADAIAAIDGVDCLYLGQVDLGADLAFPANTTIRVSSLPLMRSRLLVASTASTLSGTLERRAGSRTWSRLVPTSSCAGQTRSLCATRLPYRPRMFAHALPIEPKKRSA